MNRIVTPEILDTLKPNDPAALANRRDLILYNNLMGNFRWMANVLSRETSANSIIELGAGDGSMGLYLLNHGILSEASQYTGVDLIERPDSWPDSWEWKQQDLREIIFDGPANTLIANLILHQFEVGDLINLGKLINQSRINRLFICEPSRKNYHTWQVSLTRLLRIHPVTLHDAKVSVLAGFRKSEVTDLMRLSTSQWDVRWEETFLGANRLVCRRK